MTEFARVPLALALDLSVSAEAARMYWVIASWPPSIDGLRYIHRSELATALGIKELQVFRLTMQLCAAGWLTKSGNRPARYLLFQEKNAVTVHGQSDALAKIEAVLAATDDAHVRVQQLHADLVSANLRSWCAHCCCWHTHSGGHTSGMEANP